MISESAKAVLDKMTPECREALERVKTPCHAPLAWPDRTWTNLPLDPTAIAAEAARLAGACAGSLSWDEIDDPRVRWTCSLCREDTGSTDLEEFLRSSGPDPLTAVLEMFMAAHAMGGGES